MRISDWSSDVCSSDLVALARVGEVVGGGDRAAQRHHLARVRAPRDVGEDLRGVDHDLLVEGRVGIGDEALPLLDGGIPVSSLGSVGTTLQRSEEHTSELQSLMRISYAVFCLKKKTNN